MNAIWEDINIREQHGKLEEDIERDIVVVGGGIAGFLAAYRLAESGKKVTLVEAEKLFGGVTCNTTAHIDCINGFIYSDLVNANRKKAQDFFNFQLEAIDEYERLVKQYDIKCDFKRVDSYFYSITMDSKLKDEYIALKSIGADVEYLESADMLNINAKGAIKLSNQAMFDPIKFLNGLPVKFEIYENTRVINVSFLKKILFTDKAKIYANKIIISTNFPIINLPGFYFIRMYKSQSYAVAINRANDIGGIYSNEDESGITFRNYKDNLIVGGYDHRTGRTDKTDIYDRLYENGVELTNNGECTHKWTSNDCITFDDLPYVGYYCFISKDIYIISGFNKLGMAKALSSAQLITDMINGVENKYAKLCSPTRKGQLNLEFLKNLICVVKNLVIKPLLPPLRCYKSLNNDEGAIVFYKGKKKAVYKDNEGLLHICQPLCKHLHCQLVFNPEVKTWDCPCHGSRFDIDGNIITAPTVKKLKNTNTD